MQIGEARDSSDPRTHYRERIPRSKKRTDRVGVFFFIHPMEMFSREWRYEEYEYAVANKHWDVILAGATRRSPWLTELDVRVLKRKTPAPRRSERRGCVAARAGIEPAYG